MSKKPTFDTPCAYCEVPLRLSTSIAVKVSDGRPSGTPNRWRVIGHVHTTCWDELNTEWEKFMQSKLCLKNQEPT